MDRWLTSLTGTTSYRHWLRLPGSLTQALTSRCPRFSVNRLRQELDRPFADETGPLELRPNRLAMVREVLLNCDDRPLVFAHSVIPMASLTGPWLHLAKLGNRPLGATLFADPRISRRPLEFRCLDQRHPLYLRASQCLATLPARLWARRSLFASQGHPILVTEVFLPEVLQLP